MVETERFCGTTTCDSNWAGANTFHHTTWESQLRWRWWKTYQLQTLDFNKSKISVPFTSFWSCCIIYRVKYLFCHLLYSATQIDKNWGNMWKWYYFRHTYWIFDDFTEIHPIYQFYSGKLVPDAVSMSVIMEFSLNRMELSVNSANSGFRKITEAWISVFIDRSSLLSLWHWGWVLVSCTRDSRSNTAILLLK